MTPSWMRLMRELGTAQVAASETIARRLAGFAAASRKGRLHADPELRTMVMEKAVATARGMMALAPALLAAGPRVLMDPRKAGEAMASVTSATLRPALSRTRTNARRLRRRG